MKRLLAPILLILVIVSAPLALLWVRSQEMTHLYWVVPGILLGWPLLFGIHYWIFGKGSAARRGKRVLAVVAVVALSGWILSRFVRYEGSVGGSSYPKFSWVWQEEAQAPAIVESAPAANPPGDPSRVAGAIDEVPEFLGPGRDGIWARPAFGSDWSQRAPELLWRRPLGGGWSSFVVQGSKAYTQQQSGDDEQVLCLEVDTGRELWHHADPGTRLLLERAENEGARMGGDGPRATPTLHDGRLYSMGGTGIVHCLDAETGTEVWSKHLIRELKAQPHKWGMANSPLVLAEESLVVFTGSDQAGATLIACDLATGGTRWTCEGSGGTYSSPVLVELAGRRQIINVNQGDVAGIDPVDGKVLWTFSWPGMWPKVGQPIVLEGNRILVTASYGVGSFVFEVTGTGQGFAAKQIWKSTQLKTKFSSAAVLGDHAYGLDEGRLACISLADGKRVWKNEKFGFGQHLLFGDQLLVQTEPGEIVIGRIGPEGFRESGRIPALSSMTWNVPVVAGRILLARNDREASAWLLPEP